MPIARPAYRLNTRVPRVVWLVGAGLLLIGAGVRLVHLGAPPLDFHATRQYRSALIARGDSAVALAPLSEAQRDAARAARMGQDRIEPEVIETVAVALYTVIGREDLRAPRAVSVAVWLLGGVATAWLVRLMGVSWPCSLVALGLTLMVPFGISASRAFMPDPLMTTLTTIGLAIALWHHQQPSIAGAAWRLAVLAAALYVKPMSVFFLAPPLLAVDVARLGAGRGLLVGASTIVLAAAPAVDHYWSLYQSGINVSEARILPELLARGTFWLGWGEMLGRVIGWPALVAALGGVALVPGVPRWLLGAAWFGYAVFGLLFTHHISTHDYYSLPILPLAAASISVLLAELGRRRLPAARTVMALILAAIAASLVTTAAPSRLYGDTRALRAAAADYARIGQLVDHRSVVSLDGSYGFPLSYHALVQTQQWPLSFDRAMFAFTRGSEMPAIDRLAQYHAGFFVGTHQPEFDAQPDLRQLLDTHYALVERAGTPDQWRYVVYDLRTSRLAAAPDTLSLFTRVGGRDAVATIDVQAADGVPWRAESNSPAVTVDASGRVGSGTLQIAARPQPSVGDQDVTVRLTSDRAIGVDLSVRARTVSAGTNAPPFGAVDLPTDPVTVGGVPVAFQGWALDDVSLVRVAVVAEDASGGTVELGTVRFAGARPDVAKAFPSAHDLLRAAWIFELRPERVSALPRPVTVVFRAVDGDGAVSVIGRRRIN